MITCWLDLSVLGRFSVDKSRSAEAGEDHVLLGLISSHEPQRNEIYSADGPKGHT